MRGSKILLPFETMVFNEIYSLAHEPQTTGPNENAKFLHLKSRFPSYTLDTKLFLTIAKRKPHLAKHKYIQLSTKNNKYIKMHSFCIKKIHLSP